MNRIRGQIEAILASICFGLAPIFAKKGLLNGLNPLYGATISSATALFFITIFFLAAGPRKGWATATKRGLMLVVLAGICNSVAFVSLYWAMAIGKVAIVVPMTCIYPFFIMALAYLAMKEDEVIDVFTVSGTILIVIGVILTI